MKIMTAPFLPVSALSECSAPSASGNLKSSIVVPIAGGAGRSLVLRPLPATAARAITRNAASKSEIPKYFFICRDSFRKPGLEKGKIISHKLDVASAANGSGLFKDEVSTESGSDRVAVLAISILATGGDPVATTLGTDCITVVLQIRAPPKERWRFSLQEWHGRPALESRAGCACHNQSDPLRKESA